MRLIDADALKVSQVRICDANGNCYGGADVVFLEDINKAETIDVVKRGKWVSYLDGEHIMPERYYQCSECGSRGYRKKYSYCAVCGAQMV